jgi:Ca-activated chloride channel family protein
MTNPSFNPDDPRLTALVLGELDSVDRAIVEQLLSASPEARAFVDDLQNTIGVLRDELSSEPAPALTDEQRTALQVAATTAETDAGRSQRLSAAAGRSRRALLSGTAATIAALGIVVAALPQFARHRQLDSAGVVAASLSELNDDATFFAAAESDAQAGEPEGTLTGARGAELSGRAQLKSGSSGLEHSGALSVDQSQLASASRRSAFSFESKPSHRNEALQADEGQQRVAIRADSLASESAGRPVVATLESQTAPEASGGRGGFAALNSERSARSNARPDVAGDTIPSAGDRATGSDDRLSSAVTTGRGKELPALRSPIAEAKSDLAKTGRPPTARPEPAATAPGVAASGIPYFDAKPPAVPGAAGPARGRVLPTAETAQPTDHFPFSATDSARPTVVGESLVESRRLVESRKGEQLSRAGRPLLSTLPRFGTQPADRPTVLGLVTEPADHETYEPVVDNEFVVPDPKDVDKRLSTISIDVDTASYSNVRRFLMRNQLPPANAVRIEELVNYFKYDYPQPDGDDPFSVTTEIMLCPWQPGHRLARIGLQARTIDKSQRPPANLVFLVDVSGSMRPANKLPLVQQAMRLLVEEMTEDDQIAIVTYASSAGLRLASTPGSKKSEILQSIDALTAGGSTNGEGGIKLAYDTAIRHYIAEGANRVVLCTDGDFNVGVSNDNELVELIQEKAASGVFLSVFGFGMGNLKDGKLEKLADKGNGQYGYIDGLQEARRAFNEDLAGTLYTVAKDVKIQAEFNPATVGAYRLIGYENRVLAAADFTDDTRDAGEIGAGHAVTALYEIVPRQVMVDRLNSDEFRYTGTFNLPAEAPQVDGFSNELFFVRLRYKKPNEETSQSVEADFPVSDLAITGRPVATPSTDFQFAAAVASFGMNLRNSQYRGNWDLRHLHAVAVQTRGEDSDGRRAEFIDLVQRTMQIKGLWPDDSTATEVHPTELPSAEARIRATVDGKYRRLLKKIEVREDLQRYGAFNDFGFWDQATEYKGHSGLLPGHWVYVYPHWYIWAERDESRVSVPETRPGEASATPDSAGDAATDSPGKR